MHFEGWGLGGEAAQFNTNSLRYGHFDQSTGTIKTLGSILASATASRPSPIVDVLKIGASHGLDPPPSVGYRFSPVAD